MPINRIQFQRGVSMPEFFSHYGSEEQCSSALKALRWPQGFHCPRCNATEHYAVGHGSRTPFECCAGRHQTSHTAGP